MPNHLAYETSPYLLQHAHNPVAWYPWGSEALAKAQREDKPIFLSVGYSACHWCHVMERESFENEDISRRLNEDFVSIKVDREERPDLDQVYMQAVQMLTGRGGWPMSVFLTPDLQPFYGGTYWPPTSRSGLPGFDRVLAAVADAWKNRRQQAVEQAEQLTSQLRRVEPPSAAASELHLELLWAAEKDLLRSFDAAHGGFGQAPKFPHPMALQLALRIARRRSRSRLLELVQLTLDKMWRGGIYDHLGGGFARYSVDDRWLVPHFEKMLYDNALLADAYLDFYRVTGEPESARVVRETLDYVLRDMTDPSGGLYSSEDADSEGEEGKFYLWTPEEIREVLGREAAERFCYVYDVTHEGNFEGRNILNLPKRIEQCARAKGWDPRQLEPELAASKAALRAARDQRVHPGKDDKVLTDWNALMIHTLARAGVTLVEPRYVEAGARAATFVLAEMRRPDGRLLHVWRRGTARHDAYLDDYAFLINALVTLYEASFDERWIDEAVGLAKVMNDHFRDGEAGGFFFTADDHEALITRSKILYDNPTPSGNAMAAMGLLRLARLCGGSNKGEAVEEVLRLGVGVMRHSALAASQLLNALDMYLGPTCEVVVLGDANDPATSRALLSLRRRFVPNHVLAYRAAPRPSPSASHLDPLFAGKVAGGNASPTVYVCEDFACQAPAVGAEEVERTWERLAAQVEDR